MLRRPAMYAGWEQHLGAVDAFRVRIPGRSPLFRSRCPWHRDLVVRDEPDAVDPSEAAGGPDPHPVRRRPVRARASEPAKAVPVHHIIADSEGPLSERGRGGSPLRSGTSGDASTSLKTRSSSKQSSLSHERACHWAGPSPQSWHVVGAATKPSLCPPLRSVC